MKSPPAKFSTMENCLETFEVDRRKTRVHHIIIYLYYGDRLDNERDC